MRRLTGGIIFLIFSININQAWSLEFECALPQESKLQSIRKVHFGFAYPVDSFLSFAAYKADVFLVCGGSDFSTLEPLCIFPAREATKITIFGNEYNNFIVPAIGGYCGDFVWHGNNINRPYQNYFDKTSPHLAELLIFGRGGDDFLTGLQDEQTKNFIFGDYGPGEPYEFAGPGFDIIHGGPGDDTIYGEDLDDIIYGYNGDDYLVGGQASGCYEFPAIVDEDIIFGGPGSDTIFGDTDGACETKDILCGSGVDPTTGVGIESNRFYKDRLSGQGGADTIIGGQGDDALAGDISPWNEEDILCGGLGRDSFSSDSPDVVYYETVGEPNDEIDHRILKHTMTPPTKHACTWNELCPPERAGQEGSPGEIDPTHWPYGGLK